MPEWLKRFTAPVETKDTGGRTYDGFTREGAIVMTDGRGGQKADFPKSERSMSMGGGDDPLAIYKPTGAKSVDSAKAMANFTGWVFAAVNAIASEIANVHWRLYQITGDDHEEQDDHDLLTLLDGVNEHMTGIELKYTTVAHLELTGNCYWLLDGVKSDMDVPKAIYPLNPGRVRVKMDKSTFPYKISHYEFTIDGKVFRFEPYQILHFKYPDPSDPYVGIGVPQTIPTWIDSDNYAMEYNRKFFINGASIGMYISTDTNVEGNLERIKQGFQDNYAGNENAHRTPVLPKGAKLEHTGVTHKDMDFSTLTDDTRDRILAGFRVSKTILGTAESDTNRATAETADYVFSKRTIKPKMLLIVSYLNEFLVPRYGDDLYLTFLDPVPEDKAARTTEMTAAGGTGVPLMTQNEARKNYLGLGPVEGGDKLMVPQSLVAAGTTSKLEGEDQSPNLAKTARTVEGFASKGVRVRPGGKTAFKGTSSFRSALLKAFSDRIAKSDYKFKRISDLTKIEYMEHYKRFDNRTQKAVGQLKDIFKDINEGQKKEVLENLSNATGVKKDIGLLFDVQKWINITVDLATPIINSLTQDEAAAAVSMVGAGDANILANAGTRAAVDAGIQNMAKSYNETTLADLKVAIGDKMTQPGGTNLTELTQAVNDTYDFADSRRAGLIAKTESYRASNFANLTAWQQSGVVKTVKWYTAEDANVCDLCEPLDGKEVDIGDDFFNARYGDGNQPPLHPDCRCYIRPEDVSIE